MLIRFFLNGFIRLIFVLYVDFCSSDTITANLIINYTMTSANSIPVYKLYGEDKLWPTPDMMHCESIAARSILHNWEIRPHQHSGLFQILYLKRGEARIHLDDKQQDMHAGQILIVPQMCIHGFAFDRDAVGHVITVAYPLVSRLTQQTGDSLTALTVPSMHTLQEDDESNDIKSAFTALDREYKTKIVHRHLLIEFLLGTILIRLLRSASRQTAEIKKNTSKAGEHFQKFSALIEGCYQQQYPVTFYAHRLGITAQHLNAVCRLIATKSALTLIHDRTLMEAKRNLVYTSMTISAIAYAIGFTDPAYFTRFFTRLTGMSPKDFRKNAGVEV